jgi:DNA repair protein RecN (Recombination protein N)
LLKNISIKNYALIEDINVDFNNGLSVITGETGAGKSILIKALSLILGKRSDISAINNIEKKCIVEGTFDLANYNLKSIFKLNNLDYETETIIRREILPSGKSRAFVNDSPVVLSQLTSISEKLIDIHSQNQNLELVNSDFQFDLIDAISDSTKLVIKYQKGFDLYNSLVKEHYELKLSKIELNKAFDYNNHLLEEINALNLSEINLDDLENENQKLSNFHDLKNELNLSSSIFNDEQFGIISLLNKLNISLKNMSDKSDTFNQLSNRFQSAFFEIDDIRSEIENANENLVDDPKKLLEINKLLSKLDNLFRKHGISSIDELIVIQKELLSKVSSSNNIDKQIKDLSIKIKSHLNELQCEAKIIHNKRLNVISLVENDLQLILSKLGMKSARFKIGLTISEKLLSNGIDKLDFKFSANKGFDFKSIKQSASGGEKSRIMLAFKSILAKYKKLPTLMFDEIDTGVSGEISNKMGDIMSDMSSQMQIFVITHLPQIASKGDSHFKVFKQENEFTTSTNLIKLNHQDRIVEIAKMLEGDNISNSAVAHAKQLLN